MVEQSFIDIFFETAAKEGIEIESAPKEEQKDKEPELEAEAKKTPLKRGRK